MFVHAVADIADGGNQPPAVAELLPQGADVNVNRTRVARVGDAPHVVQQHFACDSFARVRHQERQQLKLHVRQGDFLSARGDAVAFAVKRHVAQRHDGGGRLLLRPPQQRTHARQQFHHAERLRQVIVRAAVQSLYLVHFRVARGDENHGHAAGACVAAQEAQQGQAVLTRQHHVQQHAVRHGLFQRLTERGGGLASGRCWCSSAGRAADL